VVRIRHIYVMAQALYARAGTMATQAYRKAARRAEVQYIGKVKRRQKPSGTPE